MKENQNKLMLSTGNSYNFKLCILLWDRGAHLDTTYCHTELDVNRKKLTLGSIVIILTGFCGTCFNFSKSFVSVEDLVEFFCLEFCEFANWFRNKLFNGASAWLGLPTNIYLVYAIYLIVTTCD